MKTKNKPLDLNNPFAVNFAVLDRHVKHDREHRAEFDWLVAAAGIDLGAIEPDEARWAEIDILDEEASRTCPPVERGEIRRIEGLILADLRKVTMKQIERTHKGEERATLLRDMGELFDRAETHAVTRASVLKRARGLAGSPSLESSNKPTYSVGCLL